MVFTPGQYLLILAVAMLAGVVFLSIGQALVGLVTSATTVNAIGRVHYIVLILVGISGIRRAAPRRLNHA